MRERHPSHLKKNKHNFCNQKCYWDWVRKHHPRKNKTKVKCEFCGKEFELIHAYIKRSKHYFCSRQCFGKWIAKTKAYTGKGHPGYKGGKTEMVCNFCGKKFWRWLSEAKGCNNSYCDKTCYYNYLECFGGFLKGEKHPGYIDGNGNFPHPLEFSEKLKEKIRQRDGNVCWCCDSTKKENGRKLAVHHIDYDKKNNKEENLISLCDSCHGKTNKTTNHNREFWQAYFIQTREA